MDGFCSSVSWRSLQHLMLLAGFFQTFSWSLEHCSWFLFHNSVLCLQEYLLCILEAWVSPRLVLLSAVPFCPMCSSGLRADLSCLARVKPHWWLITVWYFLTRWGRTSTLSWLNITHRQPTQQLKGSCLAGQGHGTRCHTSVLINLGLCHTLLRFFRAPPLHQLPWLSLTPGWWQYPSLPLFRVKMLWRVLIRSSVALM